MNGDVEFGCNHCAASDHHPVVGQQLITDSSSFHLKGDDGTTGWVVETHANLLWPLNVRNVTSLLRFH